MAKTSAVQKNERRRRLAEKFSDRRFELKKVIKSAKTSEEEKDEARVKLAAIPRNANPNRVRNRCSFTGRPRAVYRRFGVCRIVVRDLAHEGKIPGMRKASW